MIMNFFDERPQQKKLVPTLTVTKDVVGGSQEVSLSLPLPLSPSPSPSPSLKTVVHTKNTTLLLAQFQLAIYTHVYYSGHHLNLQNFSKVSIPTCSKLYLHDPTLYMFIVSHCNIHTGTSLQCHTTTLKNRHTQRDRQTHTHTHTCILSA